jgi:hypothetical protein
MFAADLAAIFADESVTVAVTFGAAPTAQTTRGILATQDVPEPDGLGGIVIVKRQLLTIHEGSITGLADDQPITVDGTIYKIHRILSGGRGRTVIVIA